MRPACYSYLGHYSARWSRRSRWGSSGGCSASPAPGGPQRPGSCHSEVTRSRVSSSKRSASHCELTLWRARRPDRNWQLLRHSEPSVRQIPRPRGCRRFAAPSLVTGQTPGWWWWRGPQQVSLIIPVMRTLASMLHDILWWSQTIRWWPSRTISRHWFEYKVIFGPRRKHIWCVQRKQSDTIRHTLTGTSPIIPCLPRNFPILITNLSILLEVWNHTDFVTSSKNRGSLENQNLELDKIWASSRLCG